ncbi:unnamed protein product [Effrenium voratum]|nr:unnamed protein product [Effrenium voratum]
MEYGLPSTHTINTLCIWSYILYFYSSSTSFGDGMSVYWNIARSPWLCMLFGLNIIWCLFIMWGRVYLGMHSPVDIGGWPADSDFVVIASTLQPPCKLEF